MSKITNSDMVLGKRIKKYRRKASLTQEQLAEKAHLSTTHIGLVETGNRRLSLRSLQKITSILGIKVKDIVPY